MRQLLLIAMLLIIVAPTRAQQPTTPERCEQLCDQKSQSLIDGVKLTTNEQVFLSYCLSRIEGLLAKDNDRIFSIQPFSKNTEVSRDLAAAVALKEQEIKVMEACKSGPLKKGAK